MQQKILWIANWKMQLSFAHELDYAITHKNQLIELTHKASIVLCPSTAALYPLAHLFKDTPVCIGAQNCSEFGQGPYTGQESAQSLRQAGATFCIIGHSEYRAHAHENDLTIAHKLLRLLEASLCPIICVGETREEYEQGKTTDVLIKQLNPLFDLLKTYSPIPVPLYIAYEPLWSIGTGKVPSPNHLATAYSALTKTYAHFFAAHTIKLLYGGSVAEETIHHINKLSLFDGFLLGGASLDFQKFKNIVSLT